MKVYKGLGRSFLQLRQFDQSKMYLCKFLHYAWVNNSERNELEAYDLLGMYYFYTGNLKYAQFYHERTTKGTLESNSSDLRVISIHNIKSELQTQQDIKILEKKKKTKENNLIGRNE